VHDRACGVHALGDGVGHVGDVALGEQGAEAQRAARDRLLLLERDGEPVERAALLAARVALGRGRRLRAEVLVVALQQAVDRGLDLVGPRRHRVEGLERGDLPGAEPAQDLGGAQVVQVGHDGSRLLDAGERRAATGFSQ